METESKQRTGQMAEDLACRYLVERGFTIRDRNWRFKHKELDIIAQKDNILHVVEVRSRREPAPEDPALSIDRNKRRRVLAATQAYISFHRLDLEAQIDVISIIFTAREAKINYIPNAIYPHN